MSNGEILTWEQIKALEEEEKEKDYPTKPSGEVLTWEEIKAGKTSKQIAAERREKVGTALWDWGGRTIDALREAQPAPVAAVTSAMWDVGGDILTGAGSAAMRVLPYFDILGNPVRVGYDEWRNAEEWAQAMGYQTVEEKRATPAHLIGSFLTPSTSLVRDFPRVGTPDYGAKLFAQGVIKGLKGVIDPTDPEGRVVYSQDWMDPEYVENHPIGSFTGGLAHDMLLDPFTYSTFGIGPAIRFIGHLLKKLGNTKVGQATLSNSLMQGLNVYVGDPAKVKALSRKLSNEITAGDYFEMLAMGKNTKAMDDMATQLGMSPKELHLAILRTLEGYLPGQAIIKREATMFDPAYKAEVGEVDTLADAYKDAWGKLLAEEIDAGVPISDLMKNYDALQATTGDVMGYVPHLITEIGKRGGVHPLRSFSNWFNLSKRKTGPAVHRKSSGTIEAQNIAAIKSGRLKAGEEYKHTNPALLNYWRQIWHNRSMATSRLRDGVREFGSVAGHPENWVPIKYEYHTPQGRVKDASLKNADGEELFFRPDVAEAFGRQQQLLSGPKTLGPFLKSWDSAQNWWKLYALATRPGYYTRNLGGNFTNAYTIAGLTNPQRYGDAAALQFRAFRARAGTEWGDATVLIGGKNFGRLPSEEVWEAFIMQGLHNRGQYGLHGDIGATVDDLIRSAKGRGPLVKRIGKLFVPSSDNELVQAAFRAFGATPENNAKLAVFIDQLGKMDAHKLTGEARQAAYDKAADMVRKSLFDYSDVSQFERAWAKRAFPFYKWSRNNIPAHLLAVMQHPERYQKLNLVIQNIQYGVDIPAPEDIEEWMRERAPLYLSADASEDIYHIIPLLNWMPYADLAQLGTPKRFIEQMASPFLKLPMEYWANYDVYRKGDLQKYKGETSDFLGVEMPVYMHRFLSNMVFLSELDRGNPWEIFGAQIPDPETGQIALKKMAYEPFFQKLHDMGITEEKLERFDVPGLPISIGGTRETRLDYPAEAQIDERDWDKMTPAEKQAASKTISDSRGGRLLQFLTGLRVYQGQVSEQQIRRKLNLENDIKEAEYWLGLAYQKNKTRRIAELYEFISKRLEEYSETEERIRSRRTR